MKNWISVSGLTSLLFFGQVLAEQSSHEGGQKTSSGLFQLDPGVSFWGVVVFLLLVLILKKFAWGPILSSIDTREKNLRESIEKAKDAHNESKKLALEQSAMLAATKLEAANIIREAKIFAEEAAHKIKEQAQIDKQKIVEAGLKEIESAKHLAISEIKIKVTDLALRSAEKLISQKLDQDAHRLYIEKIIEELDSK